MDVGNREKPEDEGVYNLFEGEMTWSHSILEGKKFVRQL
jgi:hypothetical protein